MRPTDVKVFTKTLSHNSYFDQHECGCKMAENTDCKSHSNSLLPSLKVVADQTNCKSDGKQEEKSCDVVLKKPSQSEEHENITLELSKEVCCPSKAGRCSGDDHETNSTETSCSVTVLPQPSMQTSHPAGNNQLETESPSQAITRTSRSPAGDHFSNASLNVATELQVTGHNDNRSTGARPKLIASRTLKKNRRSKTKHKSVTWSEETKCVTFVDDVTYDRYRNCILNLPFPNNSRPSSAVEAVLFMRGNDEQMSLSLIDIAVKFLWVKLGFCPKAVPLYTTITDFNYDERSFVLAFLELYQTEPSRTVANALFGNIQTPVLVPAYRNPASQDSIDETDNIPSQMFVSTPEQKNISHSLTDNKSVINSGQQSAQVFIDEPLKALDNHIPETVSHFQGNLQLPGETNHPVSHNNHPVSYNNHPVSHINHPVSHINHPVLHNNHPVSHIHHPVSHNNHPSSHIHHADSITDIESSRKQQGLRVPQEQMQHLKIVALKREQEYLKKALTCVLCKNKPAEVTLLPCGHFVLCSACSNDCYVCPVCNKEALAEVKTFLC